MFFYVLILFVKADAQQSPRNDCNVYSSVGRWKYSEDRNAQILLCWRQEEITILENVFAHMNKGMAMACGQTGTLYDSLARIRIDVSILALVQPSKLGTTQ